MSRISVGLFSTVAASLVCASLAVPAIAAGDHGHDAQEFREKTMKALGGGMKAAVGFLKGENMIDEVGEPAAKLATAAAVDANKVFFPKDAHPGQGDSHVKPALWDEWPKAEGYWKDLAPAAAKLTAAVKAEDKAGIGAAVKELGQLCKTCHEAYRIKED